MERGVGRRKFPGVYKLGRPLFRRAEGNDRTRRAASIAAFTADFDDVLSATRPLTSGLLIAPRPSRSISFGNG